MTEAHGENRWTKGGTPSPISQSRAEACEVYFPGTPQIPNPYGEHSRVSSSTVSLRYSVLTTTRMDTTGEGNSREPGEAM